MFDTCKGSGRHGDAEGFTESQALKRRKEIYETLHPETKAGTAGGKASGVSRSGKDRTSDKMSFVQDTASKTGNLAPHTT